MDQTEPNLSSSDIEGALKSEKEANLDSPLKTIKTYQADVAEAIKRDNVSVIKMALAEKKRQEKAANREQVVSTETKKSFAFSIASAILVLIGLAVLAYIFLIPKIGSKPVVVNTKNEIIYADKTEEVALSGTPKVFLAQIDGFKTQKRENASIENILPTVAATSSEAKAISAQRPATGQEFLDFFHTSIPGSFYRAIQDPFMLGLYQNGTETDTFIVFKVESYENAFAGMLTWEKSLPYDFSNLFGLPAVLPLSPEITSSSTIATTSATSSTSTIPSVASSTPPRLSLLYPTFKDKIIDNRDTRVLYDQSGRLIFLYTFIDPETLVMTNSQNAFEEILGRYLQGQYHK